MLTYIAHRLAGSLAVLLAVSLIVFLALGAAPGDAAAAMAGDSASAEQLVHLFKSSPTILGSVGSAD